MRKSGLQSRAKYTLYDVGPVAIVNLTGWGQMRKSPISNSRGNVSAALMAIAAVAALAAAAIQMFQQMVAEENTQKFHFGISNFREEVRALLTSRAACVNSFGGTPLNVSTNSSFAVVKDSLNAAYVSVNDSVADNSATLTNIRLANYSDETAPAGRIILYLEYTARSAVYGGALLPRSLVLYTRKDAANTLVDCVASSEDLIPSPGSVAAFAGAAVPDGWLLCDGREISRSTYAQLFAVIGTLYGAGNGSTTFNVPDLRGEFIRGADPGAGLPVGTAQPHQVEDHQHTAGSYCDACIGSAYPSGLWMSQAYVPGYHPGIIETGVPDTGAHGAETRPRNVALNYMIKY